MGIEQGDSPQSEFVINNRTEEEALSQGVESIKEIIQFKQDPRAEKKIDISFFDPEIIRKFPSENELQSYNMTKNQYLHKLIQAFIIDSNVDQVKYGEAMKAIQENGQNGNEPINNFFVELPNRINTYLRIAYPSPTCQNRVIEGFEKALKLKKDIYEKNIRDTRTINEISNDLEILFDKADAGNFNYIITYQENLEPFKSKMVF